MLLAQRGWTVTAVDFVAEAIEDARALPGAEAIDFVVGDATDLPAVTSGPFDFFLDGACFHGLSGAQRAGWGHGVSALAAPGATLVMVAFDPWPSAAPPRSRSWRRVGPGPGVYATAAATPAAPPGAASHQPVVGT